MEPIFFETANDLRTWLEANHDSVSELWVGYYKKHTGIPGINRAESVDTALCFGWIDGLKRRVDEQTYKMRFTPRKPKSSWSAGNVKRVTALMELGLVEPSGIAAFERRIERKT